MTTEYCATCASTAGTVCVTCGKARLRRSKYVDPGHERCKRRPFGVVACRSHTDPTVRCDYCGVTAAQVRTPRSGFETPDGWKASFTYETTHSCLKCSEQIAVARDAVGGLDMGAVGAKAVENLVRGLDRCDVETLTTEQAVKLLIAVRAVEQRMQIKRAREQHEKKHPEAA